MDAPRQGEQYGNYKLTECLNERGGEAYIWKATKLDSTPEEEVVLRILKWHENTAAVRRHFEREVQQRQAINDHPHIIPLQNSGWDHGKAYLVMPYIPGGSLKDALRTTPPSPTDCITYLQQTAKALSYVHKQNIIHRDIKPANLLIGSNGILLSDFGLAIDANIPPVTRENYGSEPYCPPEQEDGKPVKASDQYALAITMCELLTGKFPDKGGKEDLQTRFPKIAKVFMRASDKKPRERYRSMEKFISVLDQAALSDRVLPSAPDKRPRALWARPVIAVACVLIVLASLSAGWLLIGPGHPAPSPTPTPITSTTPTTLCLATNLPIHGTTQAAGQEILNGITLAYEQSLFHQKTYRSYQLTQFDMNDSSSTTGEPDPNRGAENLRNLVQKPSCPNPIAVIGPYLSEVAKSEIPVAAENSILLLSPATTASCLTQEAFSDPLSNCDYNIIHPPGFPKTFARLTSTDIDQGSLLADFLFNPKHPTNLGQGGLGARRIEIVGDEEIYGTQISKTVIRRLVDYYGVEPIGINCVKLTDDFNKDPFCSLNSSTKAFPINKIEALANKIRDDHPDAIFFGGLNNGADLLRQKLVELGLEQIPFVGASALVVAEKTFFRTIGPHAANIYATFPAPDPSKFTPRTLAGDFFQAYQKRFNESPGHYSANAFDAANIVLKVIKDQIDAGKVTKESVLQAVLNHDFVGVAGNKIHFDENGDNTMDRVYTIYQSQQQQGIWKWNPIAQRIK